MEEREESQSEGRSSPPVPGRPPEVKADEREESRVEGHTSPPVLGRPLEVKVDERGIERALRRLRRVMATEGVLREIKRRRHYEKPSVRRNRKVREAVRRRRRKA